MNLKTPNFHIVLIEPEIPNNTGSIGRTCVGTACRLHLVGRLGFDIDDKAVKRAGLDYWKDLDLVRHESFEDFLNHAGPEANLFFFSKKASKTHFESQFSKGDYLIFGKETVGLSDSILREYEERVRRIPQWGPIRSLNLSNAVSVVVYEAMRQTLDFATIQNRSML